MDSPDIWTDMHRLVLVLMIYAALIHAQQKRRNNKDRHVILSISRHVGFKKDEAKFFRDCAVLVHFLQLI